MFRGHNRSRYRKHAFAFSGLLQCAYDNCTVTAELKKGKYVYYRLSRKMRAPALAGSRHGDSLGPALAGHLYLGCSPRIAEKSYPRRSNPIGILAKAGAGSTADAIGWIRARMDQAYSDKLDGKIAEHFWQRKASEWQQEEQQVLIALNGLQDAEPNRVLTASRILELANKALC